MTKDVEKPRGAAFVKSVYALTARIPYGRVTTYGHLASALGNVRGARMVGWALHAPPPELNLPCHRVVNRYGELSGGWHFGHPDVMKALLEAEDIPFVAEYRVDLARVLWVPWEDESTSADGVDHLDVVTTLEDG